MRLTDRACDVLAGYRGPFALKSFDPDIVARVRTVAPHVARGIVAESRYTSSTDNFLSPEQEACLREPPAFPGLAAAVPLLARQGPALGRPHLFRHLGHLPVMTWTVRTPEDRQKAEAYADQMVFEGFLP